MKKFTFMLIAALVAVASWAGTPLKTDAVKQTRSTVWQIASLKQAPAHRMIPRAAAPFKVTAPASSNRIAASAKAHAKAAARKAPQKAGLTDLLSATYMLCSDYYDYDAEAQQLVEGIPAAGGTPITFTLIDAQTIGIDGIISDATETILATVSTEVSEELQAEGVVAIATIADGQTLFESDYGPVLLSNAEADDEPIIAYVLDNGYVIIDTYWYDVIGGDGQNAGYMWSGFIYSSVAVPSNGTMAWVNSKGVETEVPVFIYQDEEAPKIATVYNFAGWGAAIDVTLKHDQTFVIKSQPVEDGGATYGIFYTYGLNEAGSTLIDLTGIGTETALVFDCHFTAYSPTSTYWYGNQQPATITLTEGEFIYPEPAQDVAAVPADPEILQVNNYENHEGEYYGSIFFTVPTVDVDDNDLLEEKLYYQLYSDIDGDIQPIVFTTDLYVKLTEDMSIVPYTFTDNYDFQNGDGFKKVFLNFDFNSMYDRIGVKSIYLGGGEENASEIVWADVEKPEPVVPVEEGIVWVAGEQGYENAQEITEIEFNDEITGTLDAGGGTAPKYYTSGEALRMYAGNTLTITSTGEPMTKIVFTMTGSAKQMQLEASEETYEFDSENKEGTWTGESNEVTFSVPNESGIQARIQKIEIFYGSGVVEDVLVTLPEGVEPEEYTLDITQYASSSSGWQNVSSTETALVAFDGDDVYVSGLAYWFKESYVKGTLNEEGQVVFKNNQYLGEDSYGKEYLVSSYYDGTEETVSSNFVFDFDKETRTLTLVKGYYLNESETPNDFNNIYTYASAALYTPGAFVLPDVVELPEGVETTTWYKSSYDSDDEFVFGEVQVGIDGKDIYVQGLCEYLPEAWVKGTIEDGVATFASGQFFGTYGEEYNLFFVGADGETGEVADMTFTFDEEKGILTSGDIFVLAGNQAGTKMYDYYYDVEITRDRPETFPVEAPEGLETETYFFTGLSHEYKEPEDDEDEPLLARANADGDDEEEPAEEWEDWASQLEVGFDGNDVYFQGFCPDVPEFWVKGTLSEDGKTVTIPANQFMGRYVFLWNIDYYFTATNDDEELLDIVLNYDAETKTFTTDQTLALNAAPDYLDYYVLFKDVNITAMPDVAAVPADPTIEDFGLSYGDYESHFTVPAKSVEGDDLLQSKLYYTIWVEKAGVQEQLTIEAGPYKKLTEDLVEIPYNFTDSWDIGTGGSYFYWNQPVDEMMTWTKIGLQSVYYGGGVRNTSNIAWYDLTAYWSTVGIDDINADNSTVVYYDMQGRVADANAKGMLIKQTRQANGQVNTQKVLRK